MHGKEEQIIPIIRNSMFSRHSLMDIKGVLKYWSKLPLFLRYLKGSLLKYQSLETHKFCKCDVCEQPQSGLDIGLLKGQRNMGVYLKRRKTVAWWVLTVWNTKKCERARIKPCKFCSIIVDGADEPAFGFPNFFVSSKYVAGHSTKSNRVGVL